MIVFPCLIARVKRSVPLFLLATSSVAAQGGRSASRAPTRGTVATPSDQAPRRPNVVGKSFEEASRALQRLDLPVVARDSVSARSREGMVLRQVPAALTVPSSGDVDTLFVARAPLASAQAVRVPAVSGLGYVLGADRLRAAGLVPRPAALAPGDSARARVTGQQPAAGVRVALGTSVLLSLVIDERLTVPSVIGLDSALAARRILGAGFALAPLVQVRDNERPSGSVRHQSPEPGAVERRGTVVTLEVSIGSSRETISGTVPSLLRMTLVDARTVLEKSALGLGRIDTAFVDAGDGRVLHQLPHSGTTAHAGDVVRVTVGLRRTISVVPKLIGLTRTQASVALASADLRLGSAQLVIGRDAADGVVFRQGTPSGTRLTLGSAVDVSISVTPPDSASEAGTRGGGRPASVTGGETVVAVPAVRDSTLARALGLLRDAGLTNVRVDSARTTSPEVVWLVRAQAPGAGELVLRTSRVRLTAEPIGRSRAPYLIRLTEDEARREASGEGFTFRVARHVLALRLAGARVKSQEPAPFVLTAPGTEVAVEISDPMPPYASAAAGLVLVAAAGFGGRRLRRVRPTLRAHIVIVAPPEVHGAPPGGPVKTELAISAELGSVVTEIFDGDRDLVARHSPQKPGSTHD